VASQPQTAPASTCSGIWSLPSGHDGIVQEVAIQVVRTEVLLKDVQALVRQFDARKFGMLTANYYDFALGRCELFLHQLEQLGQELRDEFGIGTTISACVGKFF
jgi:hypothetical protein